MSDVVLVGILAIVPTTIASIAGLIVALRTLRQSREIHVLVNSNMTRLKTDLASAVARIDALRDALRIARGSP